MYGRMTENVEKKEEPDDETRKKLFREVLAVFGSKPEYIALSEKNKKICCMDLYRHFNSARQREYEYVRNMNMSLARQVDFSSITHTKAGKKRKRMLKE